MLGCTVYANDINPECFKWMDINLKKNQPKKSPRQYQIFNLDGRDFLRNIALPRIETYQKEIIDDAEKRRCLGNSKIVILMNLPQLALTFLDVISEWLSVNSDDKAHWLLPIHIDCYAFSRGDDRIEDIRIRLKNIMPNVADNQVSCRFVRQVAPNKDMMCAHIILLNDRDKGDKDIES